MYTDMEDGLVSHNLTHHISLARSSRRVGVMQSNVQVTYKYRCVPLHVFEMVLPFFEIHDMYGSCMDHG